jgi:hypothetical protein
VVVGLLCGVRVARPGLLPVRVRHRFHSRLVA